jgi:hypothetical protein
LLNDNADDEVHCLHIGVETAPVLAIKRSVPSKKCGMNRHKSVRCRVHGLLDAMLSSRKRKLLSMNLRDHR